MLLKILDTGKKLVKLNQLKCNEHRRKKGIDIKLDKNIFKKILLRDPVCVYCLEQLLKDKNEETKINFVNKVIEMNQKYDCGPKGFLEKQLQLVDLRDLTEELIKAGIIPCQ
jgi:hypothetical protein